MSLSSFSSAISKQHWTRSFPLQSLLKMLWISLTSETHSLYSQGLWNLKATALYWLWCKNQPRIICFSGLWTAPRLKPGAMQPFEASLVHLLSCLVIGDVHSFIRCHIKWFLRLFKVTLLFSQNKYGYISLWMSPMGHSSSLSLAPSEHSKGFKAPKGTKIGLFKYVEVDWG